MTPLEHPQRTAETGACQNLRYTCIVADSPAHIPVLAQQVLHWLAVRPGMTVLDCTLGLGGHAAMLIEHLGPGGRYIGFDLDAANLSAARTRLEPLAAAHGVELILHQANFAEARRHLEAPVDRLLADLGVASTHLDDSARGFSFSNDGPLDMRLNRDQSTTAADLVNKLPQDELADLIYELGEERLSRRIARKIVEKRRESPIRSTGELAALVRQAAGPRAAQYRIDPATRTFMALRLAVNGELEALGRLLEDVPEMLTSEGRAAIISFHSLEDRPVKQAMQRWQQQQLGRALTRKPVTADEAELAANPRSRSAKLRVFERCEC
ncbi:MAG: 16S rRNA (cytosine(1402)-N(4))-methyltransferase RsmH [Phycisphaeraceae bacterium]|nr:16S rRNA (cytosine(1402)-N(4))-methyltransferase RsmH [Phycisphaeraceae bacterium]